MNLKTSIEDFFIQTADVTRFAFRFFKEIFFPPYEFKEVIRQCYQVGYKSVFLVGITAFIMGLVVAMQSRPTLVEFGAGAWLPAMAGVSMIREIGPVVTA